MAQDFQIRTGQIHEDGQIADHFYQLWIDNQVAPGDLREDWRDRTLQFMVHARSELNYQSFVAEMDGKIVGSAGCQLFAGLYPIPFQERYRKYGYLWGVYVEPAYRRRGIAAALTQTAVEYLRSLHCTRAILHASPAGKPVYKTLGFRESNEMRLDL